MPKVSIIIPCYNQSEFLGKCLHDIQQQTLADFECIVVDDGSTDDTARKTEVFTASDGRFHLLRKANGGTATARNAGLDVAQGEYIQFLDADDELHLEKLQRQVELMENERLDVSFTDFLHFTEDENHQKTYLPHSSRKAVPTLSLRFSLLTRWGVDFSLPPGAFMYRRSFIEERGLRFSETIRFREDWNFHLDVSKQKGRFGMLPSFVGAYYRQNPKGKTSSAGKITSGNFMFFAYKCRELGLLEFMLWAYRVSCELILLAGRVVKHRRLSYLTALSPMFQSVRSILLLLISILCLPVALIQVVVRSIVEYSL